LLFPYSLIQIFISSKSLSYSIQSWSLLLIVVSVFLSSSLSSRVFRFIPVWHSSLK
jgi:hypothetical protein